MATTGLDYMGGTPYAAIKIDFTLDGASANDKPICYLTDSSSGILTFSFTGGYSSTWNVNGKTVTKVSGNTTIGAYYVSNDVLYAHNNATTYVASYSGEIENVIIRVGDGNNRIILVHYKNASQITVPATGGGSGYLDTVVTTTDTRDLTNYIPIGVGQISMGGSSTTYLAIGGFNAVSSNKSIRLNNFSTSAQSIATGNLDVVIVYLKK